MLLLRQRAAHVPGDDRQHDVRQDDRDQQRPLRLRLLRVQREGYGVQGQERAVQGRVKQGRDLPSDGPGSLHDSGVQLQRGASRQQQASCCHPGPAGLPRRDVEGPAAKVQHEHLQGRGQGAHGGGPGHGRAEPLVPRPQLAQQEHGRDAGVGQEQAAVHRSLPTADPGGQEGGAGEQGLERDREDGQEADQLGKGGEDVAGGQHEEQCREEQHSCAPRPREACQVHQSQLLGQEGGCGGGDRRERGGGGGGRGGGRRATKPQFQ
mmetsp:Transcript_7437/g.25375  ORF Transcript_7437/g.25375 Transcript_7437/m.25375 type:complete len:265 (-) Transcript_7437:575-1369(-)